MKRAIQMSVVLLVAALIIVACGAPAPIATPTPEPTPTPVPPPTAAPQPTEPPAALQVTAGEKAFNNYCGGCHSAGFGKSLLARYRTAKGLVDYIKFAMPPGNLVADNGAEGTVGIGKNHIQCFGCTGFDGRFDFLEQLQIKGLLQIKVRRVGAITADGFRNLGLDKNFGIIQTLCFPVVHGPPGFQSVHLADHLIDAAKAQQCHNLAQILGDKAHPPPG